MDWLLKTEPSTYSFEDLVRDRTTVWDGVANPVAVKHIASMQKGDRLVIYHTGDVKSAVGLAVVESAPTPDPKDPKLSVVEIAASDRLKEPIPLSVIKTEPIFEGSPLVKMGRLSVVPLTLEQYMFLAG